MAGPRAEQPKKGPQGLAKFYLFVYNAVQVAGWSHILFQTVNFYVGGGDQTSLWDMVNPSLIIFQTAAVFEILNVAIGLVQTNLATTILQVYSRIFIVWIELYFLPPTRESVGLPLLLVAWCITEIIRYSYYALGILNYIFYFITWARYTFFYVLYPLGVTGEILVVLSSIKVADQSIFNFTLPNIFNFSFSFEYYMYGSLVAYAVLFPRLYCHMINQRRKVLGTAFFDTKKSESSVPTNNNDERISNEEEKRGDGPGSV